MIDQAQIDYAAGMILRIDSGERNVFRDAVNTENQIEAKIFGEDQGVFFACMFENGLRIHIALATDTDEFNAEIAALVRGSMKKANTASCEMWILNGNRKLIAYLKETFHLHNKRDYASIEFIMRRENFSPEKNETLEIRPYERKHLGKYLWLLDGSMTFSNPRPNHRRLRIRLRRKKFDEDFAGHAAKNEFEAFWKDGRLIGLYWRKNAEIDTLAVANQYQRKGYGTIILTRAIEMIFEHTDADYAYLYAVDWNEKGQSFYKKYGMEENGHSYGLHIKDYKAAAD